MNNKTIKREITTLEAIQEGLDRANDINAIGFPRHLISEMIKEKKKTSDKIHLEVTTWEANLIIDALDVYLKQVSEKNFKGTKIPKDEVAKRCSDVLYFQGEKFRRNLHNILTEKGYEESQAELHKETDKEIWGDK